ncbi:hypothetical protein [Bacillus cereus]|uniref:hypothetical protein n=1 Tax=Bacillus cereus TaxID=1396 RepID=UPI001155770D|nr:hypothetical protein [Bacillus cereus]
MILSAVIPAAAILSVVIEPAAIFEALTALAAILSAVTAFAATLSEVTAFAAILLACTDPFTSSLLSVIRRIVTSVNTHSPYFSVALICVHTCIYLALSGS